MKKECDCCHTKVELSYRMKSFMYYGGKNHYKEDPRSELLDDITLCKPCYIIYLRMENLGYKKIKKLMTGKLPKNYKKVVRDALEPPKGLI